MTAGLLGPGVRVGHWTAPGGTTGTTVVVPDEAAIAAVDVRGNAPATRETDVLAPWRLVERVDALVLSGGSAFGLGTAQSVAQALARSGRGVPTPAGPVPIVPAACIFDLVRSDGDWPPAEAGALALGAATGSPLWGGTGAGAGATVAKAYGTDWAVPGGIGAELVDVAGTCVGAIVVANALGDVVADDGRPVAASTAPAGSEPASPLAGTNTTLAVVTVDAPLRAVDAYVLAQVAHDGFARCLRPSHTRYDGDAVFVLATGSTPSDPHSPEPDLLDAVVQIVPGLVADATRHAVTAGRTVASTEEPE